MCLQGLEGLGLLLVYSFTSCGTISASQLNWHILGINCACLCGQWAVASANHCSECVGVVKCYHKLCAVWLVMQLLVISTYLVSCIGIYLVSCISTYLASCILPYGCPMFSEWDLIRKANLMIYTFSAADPVLPFTQSSSLLTTYSNASGIFHAIATPEFYTLLLACPVCLMLSFLGQHPFCHLPSPAL